VKTIAVYAAKGGAGKTTLAVHLAVAAIGELHVALFDCDMQQQSAAGWALARRKQQRLDESPYTITVDPADVRSRQADAAAGGLEPARPYELLVIDCPPRVDARSAAILAVADVIVVPVMPSALDIGALDTSLELVVASGKRAYIVLNACASRSREVNEAKELLSHEAIPLAPIHLGYRRAFSRSLPSGQTATEFEPRGAAAAEIAQLYKFLMT